MATDIFKKGSIEMLTLLMLQEEDIHGYQISQLIKERSGGLLTVQEGALYPLLYRMEANGYISGHQQTVETKFGAAGPGGLSLRAPRAPAPAHPEAGVRPGTDRDTERLSEQCGDRL